MPLISMEPTLAYTLALLPLVGAIGTVIAILVRMRRDVDAGNIKTDNLAQSVSELKQDFRLNQKELSDMRVAFTDLAATVKAHFQKP